jgi:hypothetical protein
MKISPLASLTFLFALFLLPAEAASSKPVALMPPAYMDYKGLKDLFQHPDQWQETRSKITTLGCIDWLLDKNFSDDELKTYMPMVHQWGLKFALEVGAVKEWGITGEACFKLEQPKWNRIVAAGGQIDMFGMDEPLCNCRFYSHKSDDYAVEETANFIKLVRENYPNAQIGDIEPYPSLSLADLTTWIDALQAKLKEKGVKGLDFFRVDVDWVNFVVGNRPGNYEEVKKLEYVCRARHIPFSLVYWAADNGAMIKLGLCDDSTWYVGMMQMGYDYAAVDGAPDEYVIESWVNGPAHTVPETDPWTFTRSALDFCNKFVQ